METQKLSHSLEKETLECCHVGSVENTAKLMVMTIPMSQNGKKCLLHYNT